MRPGFFVGMISLLFLSLNLSFAEVPKAKEICPHKQEDKGGEKRKCEAEKEVLRWIKAVHKKMKERTENMRDTIEGLMFKLDNLAHQEQESKNEEKKEQLCLVLVDYNSFYGDLGMMQEMLDLAELIGEEHLRDYFDAMAKFYEELKGSFNLKNELFLKRIAELKDKEAKDYEKKLLGFFREYFLYDIWQERRDLGEDKPAEREDE